MASRTEGSKPPLRQALDPALGTPYMSHFNNSISIAKEVLIGSFQAEGGRRSESLRILSDRMPRVHPGKCADNAVAPSLMQPRIMAHAGSSASRPLTRGRNSPHPLLRLPTTLPSSFAQLANRETSSSLARLISNIRTMLSDVHSTIWWIWYSTLMKTRCTPLLEKFQRSHGYPYPPITTRGWCIFMGLKTARIAREILEYRSFYTAERFAS